jgi:hypothetical protein
MRGLVVGLAIAAAVLLPAPPATTGGTLPVIDPYVAPDPAPRPPLPGVPDHPHEGCTVPVGSLAACPPPDRRREPASCVLPVALPDGLVVSPECPQPGPAPEGRIVPLTR